MVLHGGRSSGGGLETCGEVIPMARITFYVALSFVRADDGSLAAEDRVECPNPSG
jgi:hypothetical protein